MAYFGEHLTRQLDLIPMDKLGQKVNIVGAGAIGSFAALQLAKMGFTNLEVWDHDTVDTVNMNCQFYRFKDIGKPKVAALQELIKDFTEETITVHHKKWEAHKDLEGILVVAVDSMATRIEIWGQVMQHCPFVTHVIDPRMSIEDALLFTMKPSSEKDQASYKKTLYSDAEAVQERCTAKATIYTANLISGMVAKAVKNIACGEDYPRTVLWSIKNNDMKAWASETETLRKQGLKELLDPVFGNH